MNRRWGGVAAGAIATAAVLTWASARSGWTPPERASPSEPAPPRRAVGPLQRALPEVHTLLERASSAYHARLFADDRGAVLVTQTGFVTVETDGLTREHAMSLGPVVARSGETLVFWRSGSLREVSLSDGHERELVAAPRSPRYLLATERRVAWIHAERETGTYLRTLSDGLVRVAHESANDVAAAVLHADDVYWVAASRDGSWTIERIGLDGKPRMRSTAHQGRPPAMLAVGHDGVYFYDGPQRGVRKLTFDLQRETSVAASVVCSPLAVSDRILCAQVGGLFEIPLSGAAPLFLASERAGPVTAVAVARSRAFWVAEKGADKLVLQSVELSER